MTKRNIFLMLTIFLMINNHTLKAQVSIGADIFNRYIWRGLDLGGNSLSFQPCLDLSLSSKDSVHALSFGCWGAYTFSPTANQETDLYLTYSFKDFISLTITDYFFPGLNTGAKDNYFEYGSDSTGHVFEGVLSFNGTEKIPFSLLFAMNFYGNDARKMNADTTVGKIFMSKYLEIGYSKSFSLFDLGAFVGFALDKPNTALGESSYYLNDKPGIINIGCKISKEIEITDRFNLPLQFQLIANPALNKLYYLFGISL